MDKNEFLKPSYPLLYNHYWFFGPLLKAPPWQRYLLTLLILACLLSYWSFYWYLPWQLAVQEQQIAQHQQQLTQQHADTLQHHYQELSAAITQLQKIQIPSSHLIATLIASAPAHTVTIERFSPANMPRPLPPLLNASTLCLVIDAQTFEQLLHFLQALAQQYPTITILDMLIKKSERAVTAHLTLQSVTCTYEESAHYSPPAPLTGT